MGEGFKNIANGIIVLACTLIIPTVLSLVRTYNAGQPDIQESVTILNNYVYSLFPLVAFYFIFIGSRQLVKNVKIKISGSKKLLSLIPVILFSFFYIYEIFTNPNRQIPPSETTAATYYLPDLVIIATIVIPIIIAWVWGVLSAININQYQQKVSGVIYKSALKNFTKGIVLVIIGSIILQALSSLGTSRLLDLGLVAILWIIYLFLVVQIVGYIFIALGAKKLSKIEAV